MSKRACSLVIAAIAVASASAAAEAPAAPTPALNDQANRPPTPEELAQAEAEFRKAIGYQTGPLAGNMGSASVQVPAGFLFVDGAGAKRWAQLTANPVSEQEMGMVESPDGSWVVLFEFDDVGYVKDDDKDDLDADALLQDIREGTAAFNEQRVAMGAPALNIVGWEQKPSYNKDTHALEWCVRAEAAGEPSLNFNTRVLGRRGVAKVTLMFGGATTLAQVLPGFRDLMKGFSFNAGETYAEWRSGDKIAEYGLAALIAGGGVAVAAKAGLLGKLGVLLAKGGKAVVLGVVAIGYGIVNLVKRMLGKKKNPSE